MNVQRSESLPLVVLLVASLHLLQQGLVPRPAQHQERPLIDGAARLSSSALMERLVLVRRSLHRFLTLYYIGDELWRVFIMDKQRFCGMWHGARGGAGPTLVGVFVPLVDLECTCTWNRSSVHPSGAILLAGTLLSLLESSCFA